MNPKAETVEELRGRRKALHVGMMKLAREDLTLRLQAGIDAHTVLARVTTTPGPAAAHPRNTLHVMVCLAAGAWRESA